MFLKAKHWQLFLIMLGIPILMQFYFLYEMIRISKAKQISGSENIFLVYHIFPFIIMVFTIIFFGWFWSIAIGLQNSIPDNIKMSVKKFKVLFFIPFFYIILFSVNMSGVLNGLEFMSFTNSSWFVAIVLPTHLFSMFCIMYIMYFVAKTIKTSELKRKTSFSDYLGEFFLLWFYFIGIWYIQPKVNRLYQKLKHNSQQVV